MKLPSMMLSKQFEAFLLFEARRLELLKSSSADFDPVRLIKESASLSKSSSTSSPNASFNDFKRCLKFETVSSDTAFEGPKNRSFSISKEKSLQVKGIRCQLNKIN